MANRPSRLQVDYALAFARAMLGGARNWLLWLPVLLFWVSLNLFSNSFYELFTQWKWKQGPVILLAFFLSLVFVIFLITRKVKERVTLDVIQKVNPRERNALILFLSPPLRKPEQIDAWLADRSLRGAIKGTAIRALLEKGSSEPPSPWRMPLDAITHHLSRLEKIVVIPSSDAAVLNGKPELGTFHDLDRFKKLIQWLAAGANDRLQILGLSDLGLGWPDGVDFEEAEPLVKALESIFRWLHDHKIKDDEILVDITGGQKVPTVAGAAVALAEGRHFQYVSRRDYTVRSYDITYRTDA